MPEPRGGRGLRISFRHMSCSLNSLKGGYIGDYIGDNYKGDTRSLDNGSYGFKGLGFGV